MGIYSKDFLEKAKLASQHLVSIDRLSEKIVISFTNQSISISKNFFEKNSSDYLLELITHFSDSNFEKAKASPIISSLNSQPDSAIKEILEASELILELFNDIDNDTLISSSRTSKKQLDFINKIRFRSSQNGSEHLDYINKDNDLISIYEIYHEGDKAGYIEFEQKEDSVLITNSFIEKEFRGIGIGFGAYDDFIKEKISSGFSVYSDSIVSKSAQSVYERLKNDYNINHASSTYPNYRGDISTLTQKEKMKIHRSFPTTYIDGVRVTEPGHRIKGSPVFSILVEENSVSKAASEPIEISIDRVHSKTKYFVSNRDLIKEDHAISKINDPFLLEGLMAASEMLSHDCHSLLRSLLSSGKIPATVTEILDVYDPVYIDDNELSVEVKLNQVLDELMESELFVD